MAPISRRGTAASTIFRATPGFAGRPWPVEDYSFDRNQADLREHEADFANRAGFTYTVLDPDEVVIGCVYVYPPLDSDPRDAERRRAFLGSRRGSRRPRC